MKHDKKEWGLPGNGWFSAAITASVSLLVTIFLVFLLPTLVFHALADTMEFPSSQHVDGEALAEAFTSWYLPGYLDNQLGKNTECLSGRRDFGPSGGIFFGDNRDCKQEPARFIAGSVSKSASGCGGRLQGAGICIFSGVNCSRSIFSFCLCRYCHITEE